MTGSVLTELIPLALVVALSPLSIIPAVLVLHTPRPRPTGLAFLAGWLVGLTALTAVFLEVSSLMGGLGDKPPGWASWLRIVVGGALIVFRRLSMAHPQAVGSHAGLDEEPEQSHAGSGRGNRNRAVGGQPQSTIHLCGSGFGDRHRWARKLPRVAGCRVVRGRGRLDGRDSHIGLLGVGRPSRRTTGAAEGLDGASMPPWWRPS
jgi:Sap, sulfolipid-1-addressing protein